LSDPTHTSLDGRSLSDFDAEVQSRRFPVDRKWLTVLYRPVVDVDDEFKGTFPNGATDPNWYMGFALAGASATTALTYEWEYYSIYEYQGRNIRGMAPSHYDPTGYAAVHSVSQMGKHLLPSDQDASTRSGSFLSEVGNYLGSALSWGVDHAGGLIDIGKAAYSGYNAVTSTTGTMALLEDVAPLAGLLL